jgi:hypothetical protein
MPPATEGGNPETENQLTNRSRKDKKMATQKQQYQMITRVTEFIGQTVDQFPKESMAGELCRAIETNHATLVRLRSTKDSQKATLRSLFDQRATARENVGGWLEKVDRTGSVLVTNWVRWQRRNNADEYRVAIGQQFVLDATPLEEDFILQGLPVSFLADLRSAVDELTQASKNVADAQATVSSSVREYESTLEQALQLVQRCEALVLTTMTANRAVMMAWQAARRIPSPSKSKKVSETKPEVADSAPAQSSTA